MPKLVHWHFTASIPARTRSSRDRIETRSRLPPWLLTITILRSPARATDRPISTQAASAVSAVSVSVPAAQRCSFDLPTACTGRMQQVKVIGAGGAQPVEHPLRDQRVGAHRQVRPVLFDGGRGQDGDGAHRVQPREIGGAQVGPVSARGHAVASRARPGRGADQPVHLRRHASPDGARGFRGWSCPSGNARQRRVRLPRRAEQAHPPRQRPPPRRADEGGQPPACPAGGEDAQPRDVLQAGADGLVHPVGHQEGHIGQQHPVKPALQHRGQAVPPGRVDEDQRVAPADVLDIAADGRAGCAGSPDSPVHSVGRSAPAGSRRA